MFLKITIFKKILKEAIARGGLAVGNDGDGIILSGSYWMIYLEQKKMTKKAKAAIVELVGDLPRRGNMFRAWKDRNEQYEMMETYDREIYNPDTDHFEIDYRDTRIRIENYGMKTAILQDQNSMKCIEIPQIIIDMVDEGSREDGEEMYTGPIGRCNRYSEMKEIFWKNEACTLRCSAIMLEEDSMEASILKELEKYDFKERKRLE